MALFHYQYTQLRSCLSEQASQAQPSTHEGSWVGQCPINQLKALLNIMQLELEKLAGDADVFDPATSPQNWERLSRHTQIVNQLNQQAQVLLGLASLRAC